jgi:hypothetical protein
MSGSGSWIWIPNADLDSGSRPKLNTDLTGSGSKTLLAMQVMFTNLGIKIPGIHFQDQNIAMLCSDNNKINETMLQDIHSLNKQNMNSAQNIISGDCPTKESQEELKG